MNALNGRPFPVHPAVTFSRVINACKRRMYSAIARPGFCLACGMEWNEIAYDAERLPCPLCKASAVYGSDQLIELGAYNISAEDSDVADDLHSRE